MLCASVGIGAHALAQDVGKESGLVIPRFVSLSSDEVNLRTGPGLKYPIDWVLVREALPVEVVREFDTWREIKTPDGDVGWVHSSLLSGKRTAMISQYTQTLYKKPSQESRPIVNVEPGVIAQLNKCDAQWCHIDVLTYNGWIKKTSLWGAYSYEVFD